jgi:Fic family protein
MPDPVIEITDSPYCYATSQQTTIEGIASRVQALRQSGRLTPEVLGTIRKFFRIKNIYHSNAIEGNTLDLGETKQVVQFGLTITGKPLKDQAEARNLAEAVEFLEELASRPNLPITEVDIRQIHTLVLKTVDDDNAGRYRSVKVEISGSQYQPPEAIAVPEAMEKFGQWLARKSGAEQGEQGLGTIDGLLNAAVAHAWLVYIHPFADGNGRVARLLMNLMLMRHGYPIAIITKEDRLRYYDALEESQASDLSPFLALVAESVHESLEEYERAAAEQRERQEWAQSLASRFSEQEKIRYHNEYEVWKSAMDLLKSYFRQTAELLNEAAQIGRIYFKDFGNLPVEKYLSLRSGESVKQTWFFRVDFRSGLRSARYLFFFGYPSHRLRQVGLDVTLHLSREEPSGSYHYERLEGISAPNVPQLIELAYHAKDESFIARERSGSERRGKIEEMGQRFFEEVVNMHFSS